KRTCVLEKTGTVYCRGKIKKDKKHYLTSGTSSLNKITDRHGEPLKNIVDITVGYDHACARNKKGAVFCWGNGKYGQLGNGVSGAEYYEKNAVRCGIITRQ
ncbi:MAG: RCC1 domain-containing protein, partial [bacterium]